jgi:hypothetical protein
MAAPMLRDPPVTNATFPVSFPAMMKLLRSYEMTPGTFSPVLT